MNKTHYLPDREKEIQESRPLTNINDSFKKVIIVKDHIMPRRNDEGVLTIGLFDFLLKEDSLDMKSLKVVDYLTKVQISQQIKMLK